MFKLKLDLLCDLLYKDGVLGKVIGHIHVVEFQKRGLPHAHLLIILDGENRPRTAADIDAAVCAEIPDPAEDPELFETVVNCMLHGPCAVGKCKKTATSPCDKGYPMPFAPHTIFNDKDGHVYQRQDNGVTVERNGHVLTTARWYHTTNTCPRCSTHTSMWRCAPLLLWSSTFSNTCKSQDRANVAVASKLIWLEAMAMGMSKLLRMKSSDIWMPVTLDLMKHFGASLDSSCMRRDPMWSAYQCTWREKSG